MTSKHTPGPWVATRPSDDRHRMVAVMAPNAPDKCGDKGVRVASCHIDHVPWEVCESNARLISESPAMIEALRDIRDDLARYASTHGPGPDARLARVDAIISRIDGKE